MLLSKRRQLACGGAACLVLAALFCTTAPWRPALVAGELVWLEIAATPRARSRGLQFREHLPDGHGMLFVFEEDTVPRFWMKNTPLPLSIAFVDRYKIILDIQDMEPLRTDVVYQPPAPVRYALEMRQGWFRERRIKEGDRLWFW